jgi:hypothetical protein
MAFWSVARRWMAAPDRLTAAIVALERRLGALEAEQTQR